jgi:mRNA interferase MazF
VILCQITSQARDDEYAIRLESSDFVTGGLHQSSRIRPNRVFTADSAIVVYRAGQVAGSKLAESRQRLIQILSGS